MTDRAASAGHSYGDAPDASDASAAGDAIDASDADDRSPADRARATLAQALRRPRSLLRRIGVRASRLTAAIVVLNMIGLLILLSGALWLGQVREAFIAAKTEALRGQALLIAEVLSKTAVPSDAAWQELDAGDAREVLARILRDVPARALLFDADGVLVADSRLLNDEVVAMPLPPIDDNGFNDPFADALEDRARGFRDRARLDALFGSSWRREAREHTLAEDVETALGGDVVESLRISDEGELIVSVSAPIQLVQTVYGVVTLEEGDIEALVRAARAAVLPFFLVALGVSFALSIALTAYIARPIRRLADAAESVRAGAAAASRGKIPDFSRRKDEIGDLSLALKSMTDALYDRIEAIESFAADVAHEIKNPLTSIRSAIETLPRVKDDESRKRLIDIIQKDVGRMDRLITDISNASRLDAELARQQLTPLEIHAFLGDIIGAYEQTRKPGSPRVRFDRSLAADIYISGQAGALGQVFRNLIDNARSFSPADGEVRIRVDGAAHRARVVVDDDGPGIPPENLETIFQRFYTDRPSGAEFGANSGLGLSISRQIVEAHGGRIWAENRLADPADPDSARLGARFIVELPRI